MRKLNLVSWVITLFFISLFSSCDDEVIEGTFVQETDLCAEEAEIGFLRATIDTLNFQTEFLETDVQLIIHENGFYHLFIDGSSGEDGQLFININTPEIGVFDLETPNEFGFASTFNHHAALTNFAFYAPFEDGVNEEPYVTFIDNGGSGEFEITAINFQEGLFSGTFSFSGKRLKKDPVTLELVLDDDGNTVIESLEINCGFINEAPFINDGIGGNQPPFFNEFYAEVDGEEFIERSAIGTVTFIDAAKIVNINALTNSGRLLRIDIPVDQGEGTFNFEPISNGAMLTALYNDNDGSEALTANPGTITITELDPILGFVEATFSFTGTDPFGIDPTIAEVTNGELRMSFNGTSSFANYLEADVDGSPYSGESVSGITSDYLGTEVVTISSSTGGSIDLIFPKNIEVGSYDMSSNLITGNEKVGVYSIGVGVGSSFRSASGTLSILSYNEGTGEIEGAFEFVAKDIFDLDPTEYSVTNGVFVVRIL